jgi:hypothetical protein
VVTGGWVTQADRSRTETPAAGGTAVYLHARGTRNSVAVSVTATVFDDEDSR